MKNLIISCCVILILNSGLALSEVRSVGGTEIAYSMAGSYLLSTAQEQDESTTESSGEFTVRVGEHVVVRTATKKISFTPLTANTGGVSQDSVAAARRLLKLNLPEVYLGIMMLHQSFGGSEASGDNVCEFLVLDQLLDNNQRQNLQSMLDEAQVNVVAQDGYISFDCQRGGPHGA